MEPDSALRIARTSIDAEGAARVRCVRRARAIQAPSKHAWSVLWDEAGGRCTRLSVSLAWLAFEAGCSERSAGRQLEDLQRVHLLRVVERGARWLVELADPLELEALRIEAPPLETQRPLVFSDDDPDSPTCGEFAGENAAKTPSLVCHGENAADPPRKRRENAVANSPPIEPAGGKPGGSCDLETIPEISEALARGVRFRSSSHPELDLLNHPSHPPNPILPSDQVTTPADLGLRLSPRAEAMRQVRRGDRTELGQRIVDDAKWLARQLEARVDTSDFWMFLWAAYLRHVEGGLTGEEFGRHVQTSRRNASNSRAAYWVRAFQRLLRERTPPLPWPSYAAMRAEFERIGVGWHASWDRAWQARRDRRRQHSRDPPR